MDSFTTSFLQPILDRLQTVPGIKAIVLGGSRGRGVAIDTSDWDIGLYYADDETLDIAALNQIATALDDEHRTDLCTPIGGWGPWVTGGGWLRIHNTAVDFIYRDVRRVTQVVQESLAGRFTLNDQPGHPAGFPSFIYAAEVATCQPLWDPHHTVAGLKASLRPYPPMLKQAIIGRFAWEIGFCLTLCEKSIKRGDMAYVGMCFARAVFCMVQTLFALNSEWYLNEKGAVALADQFALTPPQFAARLNMAFAQLGNDNDAALALMRGLDAEIGALCASGK